MRLPVVSLPLEHEQTPPARQFDRVNQHTLLVKSLFCGSNTGVEAKAYSCVAGGIITTSVWIGAASIGGAKKPGHLG